LFNLKIQLADIDSDRTQDLVFTATSFDNNTTNLYYLRNKSQSSLDFTGGSVRMLDFALTNTENIYLADLNGDGLPDILAGRSEGNLEYWKNTGIAGTPAFSLEEENYLGFTSSPLRQNLMVAIADLDADGKGDLLVGDQNGSPSVISNYQEVTSTDPVPESNIVFNTLTDSYGKKNLGGKIWPTVVNLYNATKPAIVLGNALGGVHILRHDDGRSLPEDAQVDIYPNPVSKDEELRVRADRHGTVEVFSVLGQQVSSAQTIKANEVYAFRLPPLSEGLYLLRFTANSKSHTQRFVIR
jgi:hypothetical protein